MPSCCFCGRWQVAKEKNEGITFHKFPKENPTLAAWLNFAKQCSSEVKPRSVVCSVHFTEYCFDRFLRSVRLKKLAIPTIMIQRVKNAKTSYPEILMPLDQCNQSMERYVTDVESNIEGVEQIHFDNVDSVDSDISSKDNVDTFAVKKPDKMKPRMNNQKDNICQTDINDSPGRLILKRKINNYAHKLNLKNKRIKYLNQKVQRQQKSISSLKNVIAVLKDNNLLHQDNAYLLSECFGKNNYLISNLYKKNLGKKLPRKYSADLRRFALSLHFHSCKAYDFVRKEFDTILPHPRTLSKWYTNTEASPGFTKESLDTLTLKCKNADHTIYCALV
ncbi:THAP domain-containing protein 1-like [Myzus persicae]|uniref:THAP domain-containing protein 1-like n=1 Tax=Myzus persicae TaxID=13164 RepID=UPI000B939377|nr:THAP domain-containing protein 1-like [Myzus persicae]